MRSSVPCLAQRARLLLQSGDAAGGLGAARPQQVAALTGTTRRTPPPPGSKPKEPAAAEAAAAGGKPAPVAAAAASTAASPGAPVSAAQPTPAAAAASPSSAPGASPAATSSSSSSSSSSTGGSAGGGEKKGGGWGLPLLVLGSTGAAYAAYESSKAQYQTTVDSSSTAAREKPPLQQQLGALLQKGRDAASSVAGMLPSDLLDKVRGAAPSQPSSSSSSDAAAPAAASSSSSLSSDKLLAQKQVDAEDSGFKMLAPEAAAAAAEAAAADAATAASAAARDALSAAADEFPGSSGGAARTAAGAVDLATARIEEIDMTPINALFSEVAATDLSALAPSTPPSSSSSSGQAARVSAGASDESAAALVSKVAAVAAAQRQQGVAAVPAAAPSQSDYEADALRKKLGLLQDVSPAGLVAAANSSGLGAYSSSSGAPLPPQMAQLNQATADARAVSALLQQLAAQQAALEQQLAAARQEKEWSAAESQKREESLTEHFKELLREQARIQQGITARAVREAEEAVMADMAAAQLQERRERLGAVDELRAAVNALTLAFNKRTAEVKSAHEVHKVHLGALALSRALEQGQPIGPQLQHLAAGCPGDAVVEAVAASLPASAASAGLPTHRELQQSFAAVAQRAAEAAYFGGPDEGGVVAHLLAKLAVKLKVDVPYAEVAGPDAKIAQARALLQEGKLLAAADAMSAAATGSQAADLVQGWVQDARARAVADQAVKLLQAYATTTAAARA